MNSQNNNQNSSDSFEEFRRQLGLDETESSDISLFDELMNTHKRQAENEIKASPKVVFDAGDDDAPSSDDASVGVGRRIVNEDLITVASDDKSKKTSKKKDANLKRQKKKAEKEQKRELANSERENPTKRFAARKKRKPRGRESFSKKPRRKPKKTLRIIRARCLPTLLPSFRVFRPTRPLYRILLQTRTSPKSSALSKAPIPTISTIS